MNPVLIDTANGIIAGHGRVAAAQMLGLTEVPMIELAHLSDAAVQTCLTLKVLFAMSLRQTTGFVQSLQRLVGLILSPSGVNYRATLKLSNLITVYDFFKTSCLCGT